jgi:hypothetical protein
LSHENSKTQKMQGLQRSIHAHSEYASGDLHKGQLHSGQCQGCECKTEQAKDTGDAPKAQDQAGLPEGAADGL